MATPSKRPPQINPAQRVVMRLPQTDATKDPWTGAPIASGRNFADESAIDENVSLAPPEGKTSSELLEEYQVLLKYDPFAEQPSETPKLQFSVREMLILTTVAALGLAGARVLPAGPYACLVGVLAFAALYFTTRWELRGRWVHLALWSLVLMYVLAAISAIVQAK